MIKFYGLKSCDKCRKAQKQLREANIDFEYIDVRAGGISHDKLENWCAKTGWQNLLNTRSTTWRNLPDNQKENIDQKKAVILMVQNPTLIKRPIIEQAEVLLIGWTDNVKKALGI